MGRMVGCVVASHAPFWDGRNLAPRHAGDQDRGGLRFLAALREVRAAVTGLDPTLAVVMGPDHFRNFFYDVLPAICVGAERVRSFGDFGSGREDLPGAPRQARQLVRQLQSRGFDPAVSLDMGIDHGISQAYTALFPSGETALVPVMVACAGPAAMLPARALELGRALGRAIEELDDDERVVLVGSGGLAHWTPVLDPDDPGIDPGMRDYVVSGRARAREVAEAREAAIAEIVGGRRAGEVRLNPEWDRWFLDQISTPGGRAALAHLSSEEIEAAAGNGGQEVRTWLVAASAWDSDLDLRSYEPVPGWMTGMACAVGGL